LKIDNSNKPTGLPPASGGMQSVNKSPQPSSGGAVDTDQFRLSARSAQLYAMSAGAGAGEVFDAEKVAEIRSAISEGRFTVDAEKVADSLIESVRELLAAPRKAE
jgi:negative regulator of flagellin synthesis FlgM